MLNLDFSVESAEPVLFAADPQIVFRLRVSQKEGEVCPIQNILLRTQIRIEPYKRHYDEGSEAGLSDLFGKRERWGKTMHSMLWTHVTSVVPAFESSVLVEMAVPCSFDFNISTTKYFSSLESGDIPLLLLFSGTVFYTSAQGTLATAPIPWDREATFALPLQVWKAMMDHYYPNGAWLRVRKDIFEKLQQFKSQGAFPSFEKALESLLTVQEGVQT